MKRPLATILSFYQHIVSELGIYGDSDAFIRIHVSTCFAVLRQICSIRKVVNTGELFFYTAFV